MPVFLIRPNGALVGRLIPSIDQTSAIRRAQYRACEQIRFRQVIARQFAIGKLTNQRKVARCWLARARLPADELLLPFQRALDMLAKCESLDQIRGCEGAAGRAYFRIISKVVDNKWGFHQRTRRPPKDPINALFSLGYALLGQAVATALEVVGLDPSEGILHPPQIGRQSLALDLMEEFRAPVVDRLALRCIGLKQFALTDFHTDVETNGVLLSPEARKTFFIEFGNQLDAPFRLRSHQRLVSFRKCFEMQANRLKKAFEENNAGYQPFIMW